MKNNDDKIKIENKEMLNCFDIVNIILQFFYIMPAHSVTAFIAASANPINAKTQKSIA